MRWRGRCTPLFTAGGFQSLIETASTQDVEPLATLERTLEPIACGNPKNRIDDLLSWTFQPAS